MFPLLQPTLTRSDKFQEGKSQTVMIELIFKGINRRDERCGKYADSRDYLWWRQSIITFYIVVEEDVQKLGNNTLPHLDHPTKFLIS